MMDRLWRSRTTIEPKTVPKPELLLPNAIGCRIIELEMQIDDGNLNKATIIELMQEYTKAVEFYEQKGDERYKMYQRKIQNLLQKPSIDAILKGGDSTGSLISRREKAQEAIRRATNIHQNEVKKIVETSNEGAEKQKIQIEKQVNCQLQKLQQRIERKRINSQKKKLSASFSSSSTQDEVFLKSFQQVKNPRNKFFI